MPILPPKWSLCVLIRGFSFSAWLRGVLVALLVVARLAPAPEATLPDWLVAAICHAPSENMPGQPAYAEHHHCALCQLSQTAGRIKEPV